MSLLRPSDIMLTWDNYQELRVIVVNAYREYIEDSGLESKFSYYSAAINGPSNKFILDLEIAMASKLGKEDALGKIALSNFFSISDNNRVTLRKNTFNRIKAFCRECGFNNVDEISYLTPSDIKKEQEIHQQNDKPANDNLGTLVSVNQEAPVPGKYWLTIKQLDRSKTILFVTVVVVIAMIILLYSLTNVFGFSADDNKINKELIQLDPTEKNIGFFYTGYGKYKRSEISQRINSEDTLEFETFTHLSAVDKIDKNDLQLLYSYDKNGNSRRSVIKASITSSNGAIQTDSIVLKNLPDNWRIEILTSETKPFGGNCKVENEPNNRIDVESLENNGVFLGDICLENGCGGMMITTRFRIYSSNDILAINEKPNLNQKVFGSHGFFIVNQNKGDYTYSPLINKPQSEDIFKANLIVENGGTSNLYDILIGLKFNRDGSSENTTLKGVINAMKLGSAESVILLDNLPAKWSISLKDIEVGQSRECKSIDTSKINSITNKQKLLYKGKFPIGDLIFDNRDIPEFNKAFVVGKNNPHPCNLIQVTFTFVMKNELE